MLALIYLAVGLALAPVLWAVCLFLAAKLFRAPRPSAKLVFGVAAVIGLIGIVFNVLLVLSDGSLLVIAGLFAAQTLVATYALRHGLNLSWPRAIGTWFLFLVMSLVVWTGILTPLTLYVVEAFQTSSNSMAPTLVGKHFVGDCPHCGGDLIFSGVHLPSDFGSPIGPRTEPGICTACRRASEVNVAPQAKVYGPDRFFVDKTLTPQRWDLIAYVVEQEEKDIKFVHRLVGLPGETLELRHGELYVDGRSVEYAPEMVGLSYFPDPVGASSAYALHEGAPVTLGNDEYFVLGDFSESSFDSRSSGPIASEKIVGVVTLIYWPPQRWRVIR